MAVSLQTGIELNDNFSNIMYGIINSVNLAISSIDEIQQSMSANVDTSSIEGARNEINQATMATDELNAAMRNMQSQRTNINAPSVDSGNQNVINVDVNPNLPDPLIENPPQIETTLQIHAPPEPVQVPVQWETDRLDVFTGTGIERFQQEVQSTNAMLEQLSSTQDAIAKQAYNTNIFPPEAFQNLNSLAVRIDMVRDRIQQIENNSVNFGTDTANAELEQLRSQLNQAVHTQNDLNSAMSDMDVSAANNAYLRLSQTISGTERYIRDNVDEQGRFNQEITEGTQQADNLMGAIKGAVAAYVSIQTVGKALNISDELTQTKSRLDMMNDGLQTTDELVNMVYAAAQDSHGSFSEMSKIVARFGNNAKDAFGSSEEVVAFANLIQKQMSIAGASTSEASNAMLQLSQALGSGVLRGDELNSIFEQSPNLIQNISKYIEGNDDLINRMAKGIGVKSEELSGNVQRHIRDIASEGLISADIVKAAVFSASDEINAKFESMPMTWSTIWQSMQNTAIMAFQPVLQRLNDIANSDSFKNFTNGAIEAMATLANIVLNIFDLIGDVGGFIADNWSIIAPIVYGVVGALAVYAAYLAIVKGIELASAAASAIMTGAKLLAAGAMVLFQGATWGAATAQMGLNAAMHASPIVWIIILIIALITIIILVANKIAEMTGIAESGFGVITGGISVVIQFFKNLGLTVANIALGIGNAIAAVGSNIMIAFYNALSSVQAWWYDLLSTVLGVIADIAKALNKLPFVEFDYSGITSAADEYAAKSAEAAGDKKEYKSVSDAFNEGMSTFDTFQDGWVSDAFNAGAAWGDGIADKVSNFSLSDIFGKTEVPDVEDYTAGFTDAINNANMSNDVAAMKDSVDITEEQLKYLRDAAEQESVNRYTTAAVTLNQTNHNNVSSGMDLDGVINGLTDAYEEAVEIMTEGVHV